MGTGTVTEMEIEPEFRITLLHYIKEGLLDLAGRDGFWQDLEIYNNKRVYMKDMRGIMWSIFIRQNNDGLKLVVDYDSWLAGDWNVTFDPHDEESLNRAIFDAANYINKYAGKV